MVTLFLFAALAFPPQQSATIPTADLAVAPEKALAWQLEGLTQEEIREEMERRGLTACAERPLLNALSAARAEAETVRAVKHAKASCRAWGLDLQLPRPTDYLYEVANAILRGDGDRALETMRAEVNRQPGDPDVHLLYAHLLSLSEDWITAYAEATEAVSLVPLSPYAHAQRSTICYHSALIECAVREALIFARLRPQDAVAHIILGRARELQGHDEEALEAYTEAKRLNAGYAETSAGFGRVYARAGEFEKAVKAFEEAIQLDGRNAEYYAELAQLYQADDNLARAIEKWKQAKTLAPERIEISLALADAYLSAERYQDAIREYKELLENAPDLEIARTQLAKALRAEGHEVEVEQLYAEPLAQQHTDNSH